MELYIKPIKIYGKCWEMVGCLRFSFVFFAFSLARFFVYFLLLEDDKAFCETAAASLPDAIAPETWSAMIAYLKEETGRKGKGLFMPLRLALTGQQHGPSMDDMLQLLGAEKAKARLRGASA